MDPKVIKYLEHPIGKHWKKVKDTRFETDFFVSIEEGPYLGVEFVFGDVVLRPLVDEESGRFEFQYNVLYSPPKLKEVEREPFENTLAEILEDRLLHITELDGGNPDDLVPMDTPSLYEGGVVEEFNPDEILDIP